LLTGVGGYALLDPPEAFILILAEISGGTTASRLNGPDVSATRGLPLLATDTIRLEPVSGRVGNAPSWA
jgi:hypothetical protein